MLFENVHQRDLLSEKLPKENLLESCIGVVNGSLAEKLTLFKQVEELIEGIPADHPLYSILEGMNLDMEVVVPAQPVCQRPTGEEGRKRVKRDR